ncbi:DUF488 family protein [Roseobacter sp. EG26]|uniref:DUF488 domain-containing protein n=1 Tax=Roseobacter sp. EG26 TaxID=3412477 RepID=UPI003CE58D72
MFDQVGDSVKAQLMTIGYEGANIADFIATLQASNVTTLIDVRELPLSRKKGFSKNKLRQQLEESGIAYLHVKQLGDPKPGRLAARAGNMNEFRRIFGDHIKLDATREALQEVVPVIEAGGACLLCFERCHSDCHRSIVADELAKLADFELAHIGVKQGIAKQH